MQVRIRTAAAAKVQLSEAAQPVITAIQGLLAGENHKWLDAAGQHRTCDGRQLDCFRSGADYQPDVGGAQSSP
jgi:hypothetical protein